jgi:hypothetical protein
VANEQKILSLYEGHAAAYVRGKAGTEVEFGSQLLLAEAECGLIADWELVCGDPENDTVLLKRSLERDGPCRVKTVVGDRSFDSKASRDQQRDCATRSRRVAGAATRGAVSTTAPAEEPDRGKNCDLQERISGSAPAGQKPREPGAAGRLERADAQPLAPGSITHA